VKPILESPFVGIISTVSYSTYYDPLFVTIALTLQYYGISAPTLVQLWDFAETDIHGVVFDADHESGLGF
jgi:hypothetical protein